VTERCTPPPVAGEEVIVICVSTPRTDRMNAEMRIAQEEQKPYLLLGGRDRMCSMPIGVKRTACMYSWTGTRSCS